MERIDASALFLRVQNTLVYTIFRRIGHVHHIFSADLHLRTADTTINTKFENVIGR